MPTLPLRCILGISNLKLSQGDEGSKEEQIPVFVIIIPLSLAEILPVAHD